VEKVELGLLVVVPVESPGFAVGYQHQLDYLYQILDRWDHHLLLGAVELPPALLLIYKKPIQINSQPYFHKCNWKFFNILKISI
jgi:hypothetical protein